MYQYPIFSDYESYLQPCDTDQQGSGSGTRRTKFHKPCGFAYKVVTSYEGYQSPVVVHRDNGTGDVADTFVMMMYEEYERLRDLLYAEEEMTPLTTDQQQAFDSAVTCYLCEQSLDNDDKVHDHCHYT